MDTGFGPIIVWDSGSPIPGLEILGNFQITETVTVTWLIMAVVVLLSIRATRNLKKVPGRGQIVLEMLVDSINNLTAQTMGEDKKSFAPYMGTLLIFLAISNLAGLLGFRPPTADVNTTMGCAMITFTMIHVFGAKRKGVGTYLKGFAEPLAPMLPLNIVGELATPISLGFRLFGNIVGGLIIMKLIYGALAGLSAKIFGPAAPPILQTGIPAVLHIYFDLFAGVLQSFIFTMLTMVNVSMAMD
ncbi:ATP synthase F0 subcomplex A subunit [Dethiosulfatibacter aminovorans DSM 17477]|uniref:ATP synthase subunit a n=1 Tax=Dethiosulfatibacter aminovorans DSM 17477 TaxID=1121476 RepID=A0A1M6LT15_9FIRM|nr:F0F1 ATP synthase subunit A [Dethiosulfatibacter aminovorans]SHJ74361.1 ATP synthase F0 subcomplex A subunit [Dethiosulfatibacter aminovorans DSM 17477]